MKTIGICRRIFLVASVGVVGVLCFNFVQSSLKTSAAPGINKTINFQGKMTEPNGLNVANGNYQFEFRIYSVSSGGSSIWAETVNLNTKDGIFQHYLGSSSALPGSVDFNTDNIYLGITFNSDSEGEMTPRIQLSASPYAFNSDQLDGLDAEDFLQLNPSVAQTGNIAITGSISVGSIVLSDGSSNTATVVVDPLGGDYTYTIPTTVGNDTFCLEGLANCAGLSATLTDNTADAWDIQEGSNNYININTTNTVENISFGNTATNPSYSFLGTGTVSVGRDLTAGTGNNTIYLGKSGDGIISAKIVDANHVTGNPEFRFLENGAQRAKFYFDIATDRFMFQNNQSNGADAIYIAENFTSTGNATIQGGSAILGTTSQAGSIVLSDGSSNTGTIQLQSISGNYSYTIPTTTSNDTFCLATLANCAGLSATLTDNAANAWDIQEGTNNYININTTNSSENISFGNTTTNPSFNFLGSGTTTMNGTLALGFNQLYQATIQGGRLGSQLDANGQSIANLTYIGSSTSTNLELAAFGTAGNYLKLRTADSGGTLTDRLAIQSGADDADAVFSTNILPSTNDTFALGSTTHRWSDLYLGPASLHIGADGDEGVLSYNTTNNHFSFNQNINLLQNSYLNFGTTPNSLGYGIRDNSGVIEIKNLGDPDWAPLYSFATSVITGSGTPGYFPKFTDTSLLGDSVLSEVSGSIGIGIASPAFTNGVGLHVNMEDEEAVRIKLTNTTTGNTASDGLEIWTGDGGGLNAVIAQREDADLIFRTNNIERMRILSGGAMTLGGTATFGDIATSDGISISGTSGRNLFKDSELSTGNGLRVGAAWSMYGIYSESGNVTVGGAGGTVNLQNGAATFSSGNFSMGGNQVVQATDAWLRLNPAGNFASGVYVPGALRSDGAVQFSSVISNHSASYGGGVFFGDDVRTASSIAVGSAFYYGFAGGVSATSVCRGGAAADAVVGNVYGIGHCTSLGRYKDNQTTLSIGLNELRQLTPKEFDWNINNNGHDIGFIAEEVEAVSPLLSEYTDGQLSGVRYNQMSALVVRSVQQLDVQVQSNSLRLTGVETELAQHQLVLDGYAQSAWVLDLLADVENRLAYLESGTLPSLNVTGQATVGSLKVTGNTEVANLRINGKIQTAGATPSGVLATAYTSGGVSHTISGNDSAGQISLDYATSGQTGVQVSVNFISPFDTKPRVNLTPSSVGAGEVRYYTESTTSGFKIFFVDLPEAGKTYSFDYFIVQ